MERLITQLQNQIAETLAAIEKVHLHCPANIPDDTKVWMGRWGDKMWAEIPHGSPSFKILRRQLGRRWKMLQSVFFGDEGNRQVTYRNQDDGFKFVFNITPPNSPNCRLIKVGERIVNKYEILCSDWRF